MRTANLQRYGRPADMDRSRILKGTLAVATFAWPGIAAAACDPAIIGAADGPVPYGPRAGGRYCEGSYARPVRASFEILSVTSGPIGFAQKDAHIILSAPLSSSGSTLSIRARGRSITYGFQMDASLSPPGNFAWPTTALKTLQLGRTDFGVFGFRASGTSVTYVPIAAKRAISAPSGEPILVQLVAPEHIAGPIEYLVAATGSALPDVWQTLRTEGINKGEVLTVRHAASVLQSPATLRVRARPRTDSTRWVRLTMDLAR